MVEDKVYNQTSLSCLYPRCHLFPSIFNHNIELKEMLYVEQGASNKSLLIQVSIKLKKTGAPASHHTIKQAA